MRGIIYKITNRVNGKSYVGQTYRRLQDRIKEHFRKSDYDCPALYNAIDKYGIDNFEVKILCYANNINELNSREIFCIRIFRTKKPYGYNLTDGGKNSSPTKETKIKISNTLKGRFAGNKNPFFGKKHTEEAKKKINKSKRMTGKKHTEEAKKKISQWNKNKIISEESINKMKNSLKIYYSNEVNLSTNRKSQKTRKPVLCHQTNMIYDSIRHAAKELGLASKDKVKCVADGKYKQYKGYTFSYVREIKGELI